MLDRLAQLVHRRRRPMLALAFVFVIVAGVFGGPVFGLLDTDDDFEDSATESIQAREAITRATGASATPDLVALVRTGARVDSPQGRAKLERVAEAMRDRDVAQVIAYRGGADRTLVSRDGRASYLVVTFRSGVADDEVAARLEERVADEPGVVLGGSVLANEQVGEQVSEDLARAEGLAFPILFVLSLLVFRGFVAALLPLAVGVSTVLSTFLLMRGVNAIEPMSIYALNLIIGLGLGLAIDYSLFVVSRFREELGAGRDTREALRVTLATAGRTVLFSAVTVAAALASLVVFPQRFLFSMGIGGALVALMAALVSLTLLPALLVALGPRVNALSPRRWRAAAERDARAERSGPWYRLSQLVMRRAAVVATVTAAFMIALGIPFTQIRFTGVDASVLPEDRSARVVSDALAAEFPPDTTSPIAIAARAPASAEAEVRAYARELSGLPGVAAPATVRAADGLWRIDVVARGGELEEGAKALVRDVRAVDAPFNVQVGGQTAQFLDQQASLGDRLPIAVGILVVTTLVLLFLMTGSVVLPVKTLIMNLLTVSAAFGLLVLIFQDGRLEGLLGYESQGALESTQPILLFAIAFGLSTDYGVFLLTRIKEAHDRGLSTNEAVALGLQRTGRIVTFAALLFVIAIGAFATSEVIFIKQVGVGTALAVLIDATIVRALLVPALMRLLGEWNWWAPRPLRRLHARIGLAEA
jgi:uncharacterized membrane protein YdfJ with MMPL/SSD domain